MRREIQAQIKTPRKETFRGGITGCIYHSFITGDIVSIRKRLGKFRGYPSCVTLREGNLQKSYHSINTSYPIRKTWWLYLLLEKNLAIALFGAAPLGRSLFHLIHSGDRILPKKDRSLYSVHIRFNQKSTSQKFVQR
jgi:hypothetical protein